MSDYKLFAATLPLPPSINRTYKTTRRGGFYTDPKVKAWKSEAILNLRACGWKPQSGEYAISVDYTLYCARNRDIDSVSKLLIDTAIGGALCLDDKAVNHLDATKVVETKRKVQSVSFCVTLSPLLMAPG